MSRPSPSNPSVCCVMLVNGREAMVRRAIANFRAQTYKHKWLLVWNTGITRTGEAPLTNLAANEHQVEDVPDYTIGALRNRANGWCCEANEADIIAHWDSDDWSHPRRLEEQVANLIDSGKDAVGYRSMLFWDSRPGVAADAAGLMNPPSEPGETVPAPLGSAWFYRNSDKRYCVGTSLCYWRKAWEVHPFPDEPKRHGGPGEDTLWLREVSSCGYIQLEPRMIASIHSDNTQNYDLVVGQSPNWTRVPEWDDYCRERMAL